MSTSPHHAARHYILFLAILLIIVWQSSVDIYLTAIPTMVDELSTTSSSLKFSIVIAILGFGVSQLIYGPLSDYYGRRVITLIGISIFLFGSFLCVIADSIELLLIGRFIQGLGMGSAGPVVTAVPKDIFVGKELNQAFAYISTSIAMTPVVAPLLGSYLQMFFGWRANFIFLFAYGAIVGLLIYRGLPETNAHTKQSNLKISTISRSYLAALRDRLYMGYLLIIIFLYAGELAYIMQMPLILQQTFGLTPIQNGWLVVLTALGMGIGAFSSSQLVKYFAPINFIYVGLSLVVLSALAMLVLPLLGIYTITSFIAPMILYMFGSGLTFNNCIAGCMDRFPHQAGLAGALMSGMLLMCSGLLTLIMTYMPSTNLYAVPLFVLACGISMVLVLFSMIRPKS
jgi:DHA1 family 2-module integral membrane pump EmrD-like MFS transporter